MRKKEHDLVLISESLKAMAHPDRISILTLLSQKKEIKFSVNQICDKLKLNQPEVSRHLSILKNKGILDSKKGKGGGYFLANAPKKTSLAVAIRIVDGPIAMIPCVSLNFYQKCKDCNEATCGLNKAMAFTRDATLKILEKKTLYDLIDAD